MVVFVFGFFNGDTPAAAYSTNISHVIILSYTESLNDENILNVSLLTPITGAIFIIFIGVAAYRNNLECSCISKEVTFWLNSGNRIYFLHLDPKFWKI